jgi:uncharacterized protein DUF5946
MRAPARDEAPYHELAYYTLAHPDPAFIHQYVVDAFAAQNAGADTKPIKLTFALVGLLLHIERGYTGREVQRAHMKLARHKRVWPSFRLPDERGAVTAAEVLRAPPGAERDGAIEEWMRSVWQAYRYCHDQVAELIAAEGV